MSNKELYKLIENLNIKIKKLDNQIKNKSIINKSTSNTILKAYSISYPKNHDNNKKYIGLLFNENFDDFSTDDNKSSNNKISFIKLLKGNNIINYSLCIDINEINLSQQITNSIYLGIKDKISSKIRIIKGSKCNFDLNNKYLIINDKIIINNTIIYTSNDNDELCMIIDINSKYKINSSKSLIKILSL
jgi:hypothetical protein